MKLAYLPLLPNFRNESINDKDKQGVAIYCFFDFVLQTELRNLPGFRKTSLQYAIMLQNVNRW